MIAPKVNFDSHGKIHGHLCHYYNDRPSVEGMYFHGNLHGYRNIYRDDNGRIIVCEHFVNNLKEGEEIYYEQ